MNNGHWGADWAGAAFWMFIAACVVAGTWEKIRKNAEKHATLRLMYEKTGVIDEAKLKDLFNQKSSNDWLKTTPGDGFRALRVGGTVVMGLGGAAAVLFLALGQFSVISSHASTGGICVAAAVAFFGMALFFSSRFAQPPSQ